MRYINPRLTLTLTLFVTVMSHAKTAKLLHMAPECLDHWATWAGQHHRHAHFFFSKSLTRYEITE